MADNNSIRCEETAVPNKCQSVDNEFYSSLCEWSDKQLNNEKTINQTLEQIQRGVNRMIIDVFEDILQDSFSDQLLITHLKAYKQELNQINDIRGHIRQIGDNYWCLRLSMDSSEDKKRQLLDMKSEVMAIKLLSSVICLWFEKRSIDKNLYNFSVFVCDAIKSVRTQFEEEVLKQRTKISVSPSLIEDNIKIFNSFLLKIESNEQMFSRIDGILSDIKRKYSLNQIK